MGKIIFIIIYLFSISIHANEVDDNTKQYCVSNLYNTEDISDKYVLGFTVVAAYIQGYTAALVASKNMNKKLENTSINIIINEVCKRTLELHSALPKNKQKELGFFDVYKWTTENYTKKN